MNKFISSIPFQFSITQEAQKQVREKIKGMLGLSDLSNISGDLTPNTLDKHSLSLDMCIDRLSVRQCKEFLDVNVAMRIKTNWRNRKRRLRNDGHLRRTYGRFIYNCQRKQCFA